MVKKGVPDHKVAPRMASVLFLRVLSELSQGLLQNMSKLLLKVSDYGKGESPTAELTRRSEILTVIDQGNSRRQQSIKTVYWGSNPAVSKKVVQTGFSS